MLPIYDITQCSIHELIEFEVETRSQLSLIRIVWKLKIYLDDQRLFKNAKSNAFNIYIIHYMCNV